MTTIGADIERKLEMDFLPATEIAALYICNGFRKATRKRPMPPRATSPWTGRWHYHAAKGMPNSLSCIAAALVGDDGQPAYSP